MTDPTIVAINGDLAGGKSSLATALGESLGLQVVSMGTIHRAIAEERGHSTLELNRIAESDEAIDDLVDGRLLELGRSGQNLVFDSRLAFHFLPKAFKVHVIVDPAVAAERALARFGDVTEAYRSGAEALRQLEARRQSERARFRTKYGVDVDALRNYDLVVDSTSADTDTAASLVLRSLKDVQAEEWHVSGPRLFLDPKRLLPTEDIARLGRSDSRRLADTVRSYGFDQQPPILVGFAKGFFFIVDGHRRTSAAIVAGLSMVPCRLAAQDDEILSNGLSAKTFLDSEIVRSKVYDWEWVHRFRFSQYPFTEDR